MAVPVVRARSSDVEFSGVQTRAAPRAIPTGAQSVKAALDFALVKAKVFARHAKWQVHDVLLPQAIRWRACGRMPSVPEH